MAAVVSAAELPPGGEGKIEVKVVTAGRSGPLEKTIDVTSNDPQTPHLTLKMKGQVETIAAFEPSWLMLGKVGAGSTKTEIVKLVGRDASKVKLQDIRVSDSSLLKAEPVTLQGNQALKVTLMASEKEGPVTGNITAQTGLDRPAAITLTVRAEISRDIYTEPGRVYFTEKAPEVRLTFMSLSSRPFKIIKVFDPEKAVEVKRMDPTTFVLKLVNQDKKNGKIVARTDRKDQSEIIIEWSTSSPSDFKRVNPDAVRYRVPLQRVRPDIEINTPAK